MIVSILRIGIRSAAACALCFVQTEQALRLPVADTGLVHRFEIVKGAQNHPFKAQMPDESHSFFGVQILSACDETNPIALCPGVCHPADLPLRKLLQVLPGAKLVVGNILARAVQVARIRKVTAFKDIKKQVMVVRIFSDELVLHLKKKLLLQIILHIAVQNAPKTLQRRNSCHSFLLRVSAALLTGPILLLLHGKSCVHLQKQLQTDPYFFLISFIQKRNHAAKLIHKRRRISSILRSEFQGAVRRICKALSIMLRQNIRIQRTVMLLKNRKLCFLRPSIQNPMILIQKKHKKLQRAVKEVLGPRGNRAFFLRRKLPDPCFIQFK